MALLLRFRSDVTEVDELLFTWMRRTEWVDEWIRRHDVLNDCLPFLRDASDAQNWCGLSEVRVNRVPLHSHYFFFAPLSKEKGYREGGFMCRYECHPEAGVSLGMVYRGHCVAC